MSVTMPIEQKVATAREFVTRVFNEHQPERASEYFTADAVWHGGSVGNIAGRDNVVNLLRVFIGALPDLNAAEQAVIGLTALSNMFMELYADCAGYSVDSVIRDAAARMYGNPSS